MTTANRPIYEIALEIKADWENIYFGARPYLAAMLTINDISENYGMDSANSVIRYFLSNAGTWRGEVARRVKKELNAMLK